MPLTGQPSWSTGDVPTLTQLNTWLGTTVTNKFAAAITSADFFWPTEAGGDIDMDGNAITGVAYLDGVYNLEERPAWQTCNQLFRLVESRGGGVVLLPGNTIQGASTGKDGVTGIRVGNNTVVKGHGYSSQLGALYIKEKKNVIIENLRLTGANQLLGCTNVTFRNCDFTGTGSYQVRISSMPDPTGRVGLGGVRFENCSFTGAATYQVLFDSLNEDVSFFACDFRNYGEAALGLEDQYSGVYKLSIRHCTGIADTYGGTDGALINMVTSQSSQYGSIDHNGSITIYGNAFAEDAHIRLIARDFDIACNFLHGESSTITTPLIYSQARTDYFGNPTKATLRGNVVYFAPDIAVQLGAENEACRDMNVVYNVMEAADEGLVIVPDTSATPIDTILRGSKSVVAGNSTASSDATLPSAALWGLDTDPTVQKIDIIMYGNFFGVGSADGFHCYQGYPGSVGGRIGKSTVPQFFWVFVGNHCPGTTTTDSSGNDMIDASAQRSVVQDNNT
jgi:hypothetical protein